MFGVGRDLWGSSGPTPLPKEEEQGLVGTGKSHGPLDLAVLGGSGTGAAAAVASLEALLGWWVVQELPCVWLRAMG